MGTRNNAVFSCGNVPCHDLTVHFARDELTARVEHQPIGMVRIIGKNAQRAVPVDLVNFVGRDIRE